jgi:hypothetical protein
VPPVFLASSANKIAVGVLRRHESFRLGPGGTHREQPGVGLADRAGGLELVELGHTLAHARLGGIEVGGLRDDGRGAEGDEDQGTGGELHGRSKDQGVVAGAAERAEVLRVLESP